MESDGGTDERRNDLLSQSYTQGVGRVAQQSNDVGFSFELPKEVLEKREKVWDNLFDKYRDEASDEIELNINTMEPVTAEEDEDDKEEEEEEDDEDEEVDKAGGEYYSKCRAPMRKLPALIQYWVDTGNPPYQLVGDDDHSETGSSLSEGEHSRTGHSDILRESSDKHRPQDISPYSSVDTAAYILSNANVTKKSETMAIVEGAKKPEDFQIGQISPKKDANTLAQQITDIGSKNLSFSSAGQKPKSVSNLAKNSKAPSSPAKTTISRTEIRAITTPLDNPKLNDLFSLETPLENMSPVSQQSVKLSEVLPTFEQIDELLKESRAMKAPRARSSLSKVRRKPKLAVESPSADEPTPSQSSQNSSVPPNGLKKPLNRRKLYTGRNSPVDLVMEQTSIESVQPTGNCLHPALEPDGAERPKASTFGNRARARRKRKRASQAAEILSQDDNTSQDSSTPNAGQNSKGDMRYADFFESLGLTPSKHIIGETPVRKSLPKRLRKSEKRPKRETSKSEETEKKLSDTIESSIKETGDTSQLTEDSVFSPIAQKTFDKQADKKILRVEIDRLSENTLARYQRRDERPEEFSNDPTNDDGAQIALSKDCPKIVSVSSSSGSPSSKKSKAPRRDNIELLTTATHDSDSSTILICACNNDASAQYNSDSDNSLFTKKKSKTEKKSLHVDNASSRSRSLRSADQKSPVKSTEQVAAPNSSEASKIMRKVENSPKKLRDKKVGEKSLPQVFVSLEKLKMNNLPKLTKSPERVEFLERSIGEKLETVSRRASVESAKSNSARAESSTDSFKYSAASVLSSDTAKNKCVTIGSRLANDLEKIHVKPQKLGSRCSLEISMPSDEEEDSFVKLVKEFGSEKSTSTIETEKTRQRVNSEEIVNGAYNRDESVATKTSRMPTRFRSNFGISVSSDEEDEISTKRAQKSPAKRRLTELETNADSSSEVKNRNKTIFGAKEPTKRDGATKLNNNNNNNNRTDDSCIEQRLETVEVEVKHKEGVRKSMRKKNPPSWGDNDECLTNDSSLSAKPRQTRNLFTDAKELPPGERNAPRETQESKFKGAEQSSATDSSQSDKSKVQQKTLLTRSRRLEKSSSSSGLNSARFQTRLDSDSDTDFENLRFSINTRRSRLNGKAQINESEVGKKNFPKGSDKSVPIVKDDKPLRTSPRRSLKNSLEQRTETGKKSKGPNGFVAAAAAAPAPAADASKNHSKLAKTEAAQVINSSSNSLRLRNESMTSDASNKTNDANKKQKNTKAKIEWQEKSTARRKLSKSEQTKNSSKVSPGKGKVSLSASANKSNDESSPMAKKKSRRTRIVGTPMEFESDDDVVNSSNGKVDSSETSRRKKRMFPNGPSSKQLSDKEEIDEQNSFKKRSRDASKNLFADILDDTVEDIDLIFGDAAKSRAKKCTVVIDNLNFGSTRKPKNLNNVRQSTISFRTKLRSDSDDDDDHSVL